VRLRLQRPSAVAEIDLGEEGRFWPCDEALSRWRQLAQGAQAEVVYEAD
jgi:DNA polymerase-3 subunit alpha